MYGYTYTMYDKKQRKDEKRICNNYNVYEEHKRRGREDKEVVQINIILRRRISLFWLMYCQKYFQIIIDFKTKRQQ